jgi:hypothetical protein
MATTFEMSTLYLHQKGAKERNRIDPGPGRWEGEEDGKEKADIQRSSIETNVG